MHASARAFCDLKRSVSIEAVLHDKGLGATLKRRGDRLVGPCPVHGGDNPQAFVVSRSRNLWYCFTRCQGGGDVIELLRRLEQASYAEIRAYLAGLAGAAPPPRLPSATPAPRRPFRPFTRRLRLDPVAPFLARKGIDPATARRFDAGAYPGPGLLAGCVGVRVHDPEGRPLGYAGRRLDPVAAEQLGKWKLPRGLPKHSLLYNFHRIRSHLPHGLVVVECPWGVMRLAQLQIPAVALLGTHLSPLQQALLRLASPVILLLDGDPVGHSATLRIRAALQANTSVQAVRLPPGTDPDDLCDGALATRLGPLLS